MFAGRQPLVVCDLDAVIDTAWHLDELDDATAVIRAGPADVALAPPRPGVAGSPR